jgi:hypothetical protein
MHYVEGAATGRDDGGVVDHVGASDADERAVARTCDRAWLELRRREPGRTGDQHSGGTEVGHTREVDDAGAEGILGGAGLLEVDGLHASGAVDPQVGELRGVVDTQVMRQPLVRGFQQEEPHGLPIGSSTGIEG